MPPPTIRLLRPTHWVKNVFVFAPLVFAQQLAEPRALARVLVAFACFCAASSAVYAFNDLRDREEDRRHPLKRLRPVAAGAISPLAAGIWTAVLAAAALAGGRWLGGGFFTIIGVYLAINLLYSAWLKHVVILDVMLVSAGFVLRVLGGGSAAGVEISAWLLLCTIFLALFLAFSKRRHELVLMEEDAANQRRVLSHYSPTFLDQMINVVTASSVLSYALYSISPGTVRRFDTDLLVYTVPFVLFGIFRYLYLIYQKPDRLNPTEAVVRDLPSLANLALWGVAVLAILYLA